MSATQIHRSEFDQHAAEQFSARAAEIINHGAVAVMMSIGHRSGLFDTMASLPPSTSTQIARNAGLSERYVREWLAVLVTGGVLTYDAATRKYFLPAEHAACLTRGAPLGNLAVYAQNVALMGIVQEPILERFKTGAGMRYQDYPDFHQVMAEDSDQTVVTPLIETILPLAKGLTAKLERGIDVLDAGCARGYAIIALAQRFRNSRFTGYDLCDDAIHAAAQEARALGLQNATSPFATSPTSMQSANSTW